MFQNSPGSVLSNRNPVIVVCLFQTETTVHVHVIKTQHSMSFSYKAPSFLYVLSVFIQTKVSCWEGTNRKKKKQKKDLKDKRSWFWICSLLQTVIVADFMTLYHQEEERRTGFIYFRVNCFFKIICERKTSGRSSFSLKHVCRGSFSPRLNMNQRRQL